MQQLNARMRAIRLIRRTQIGYLASAYVIVARCIKISGRGTAADLASRGFIAVYPSTGWWRTRPGLERYDLPARYSLIVSIRTEQTEIDLYTAIATQIAAVVAVEH